MRVFTIGFTKKSAEVFFGALRDSGCKRVVDVRLNNISQLSGFSKRDDLRYLLRELLGIDYAHLTELAPTSDLLAAYRKGRIDWRAYETRFLYLMRSRRIEDAVPPDLIDGACLLCSEEEPDRCHRRLVVEYLAQRWNGLEIVHLR